MKGVPNIYARQTSLHDVRGRLDYISNPERQEHLLAFHDEAAGLAGGTYWETLAAECQENNERYSRQRAAVEGRELVIQLPNSLLDRMTASEICQLLSAELAKKLRRPVAVALHYNHSQSNLHAHAIYSERELLKEPVEKIAKRNMFYDEQGKHRRTRQEILDDAGQLRPGCLIVPKGEIYERHAFGPVDHVYSEKRWLKDFKTNTILPLLNGPLRGDVAFSEYDLETGKLPQQHIGSRGPKENTAEYEKRKADIQRYNNAVKEYNAMIDKKLIGEFDSLFILDEVKRAKRHPEDVLEKHLADIKKWLQKQAPSQAPARVTEAVQENPTTDPKAQGHAQKLSNTPTPPGAWRNSPQEAQEGPADEFDDQELTVDAQKAQESPQEPQEGPLEDHQEQDLALGAVHAVQEAQEPVQDDPELTAPTGAHQKPRRVADQLAALRQRLQEDQMPDPELTVPGTEYADDVEEDEEYQDGWDLYELEDPELDGDDDLDI